MSYDLHFRADFGVEADADAIGAALRATKYVGESGSAQFIYRHPNTGVTCTFDLEDEIPLSAPVNFLRPRFYGREIMPVIARLAASANLRIFDPQEDKLYSPGVKPDELERNWVSQNERITRAVLRDEAEGLPYLREERSWYWWQYSYAREDFQRSLRDDIFIPSIFLFACEHGLVRTAAVWSAEIRPPFPLTKRFVPLAQIFPECDYVILASGKKGASKMDKRYVSYTAAMEQLRGIVEDFPETAPVSGLKILRAANQARAGSVFASLPALDTGKVERIASDSFVDVTA